MCPPVAPPQLKVTRVDVKLFVLGGTGHVGRHVLAQSSAHEVTALVRPQSRSLVPSTATHVRVVEGDALDPSGAGLDAMAGHDAVVSSIGLQRKSNANPWSALTTPADLCSRSAALIVAAMQKHGVKRVVAVSAAGVAESAVHMNWFMHFMVNNTNVGAGYRDLALMENVYRASGVDWLCVRPTRLTNDPSRPVVVREGFPMSAAIAREDVARYMLAALAQPSWSERTPTITSA
jgi:putative NADH-flavin reductase